MQLYFSTDYSLEEITKQVNEFIIENYILTDNSFKLNMDLTEVPQIKFKPKLIRGKLW